MTKRRTKKTNASPLVQREWLRRVEAEYRSAAIAHHVTHWLMQIGASPDLVRAGLRVVGDEIAHAELSHRAFVAAGGAGGPALARETLELRRTPNEPLEHDVARAAADVFCLGETVAVPLFKQLRDGCTVPAARRVLDRVLRDEVRHRDFGWTLLGWMLEELPMRTALLALITRELPRYFRRMRNAYGATPAREELDDADRAWGLMPGASYARVLERTVARDWAPRFARLGIDAQSAWALSESL